MADTILITGGARSGKSRLAEELAGRFAPPLLYVATGSAGDGEMSERIARHRERRGAEWVTVEEPLDLLRPLTDAGERYGAVLVDCVTFWVMNLLFHYGEKPAPMLAAARELAAALPFLTAPLILVTSEVGMGIVPENRLARLFRDVAGEVNEILAAAADEVYVSISGLPLKLKG